MNSELKTRDLPASKKLPFAKGLILKFLSSQQLRFFMTGAFLGVCAFCEAQTSKGAAGINSARTEIASYATPVRNLLYAIAGIIALIGAFNVYFKMQNGDQDVKKTIMMTVGGCVAMVAMATALPMFFN